MSGDFLLPEFDADEPIQPATGTDSGAASHAISGYQDNLWVMENDRVWDLGPAEVDTDADGVADSLTRNGPNGVTVYTDSDHDGQVDRITEVHSDGSFSSRELEPKSGTWVPTDSGRLQ